MTIEAVPTIAFWDTPPWADSRTFDESAVEHCRRVGGIALLEYGGSFAVEIVQRDELDVTLEPAMITRNPVQVRVGDVRLGLGEVQELLGLLNAAVALVTETSQERVGFTG